MISNRIFCPVAQLPKLVKLKLSTWVTLTSYSGYFISPDWNIQSAIALGVGVFCCSASSHTANQLIEAKADQMMIRTSNRPIAAGKINRRQAISTFIALTTLGTGTLAYISPLSGLLGFSNILLYTLIYTPLKYKTKLHTHIGAIVGAVPPLIGSTISNMDLSEPSPWILFSTLYCWQIPHFYLIAWLNRKDCLKVGFKMLGIEDDSGKTTGKACIKWHSMTTLISSLMLISSLYTNTQLVSILPLLVPFFLNLSVMKKFYGFMNSSSIASAAHLFKSSLWHILILLSSFSCYLKAKLTSTQKKETQLYQNYSVAIEINS